MKILHQTNWKTSEESNMNECEDGRLYKLVGSAGNYKSIRVRKIDK
jgi:hypothetical protein